MDLPCLSVRRSAAWPCACFVLCHGTSRDPTSCFYWASKLLRGTFSATSRGPTTCFDWASTLLRGTFWAPLKSFKSLKSPAATFEGLWTAKPSAAASKLLRGTFWTPLKSIKSLKSHTAAFEGLWTVKPPQQLARASRLLAMGPPEAPQAVSILRLRNYYVACFEHPLKASKAA